MTCNCKNYDIRNKKNKSLNFNMDVVFKDDHYFLSKIDNIFEIYQREREGDTILLSTIRSYDRQLLLENLSEYIYCFCYEPQIIMTIEQASDLLYLCTHVPDQVDKYLSEIGFIEYEHEFL